MPTRSGEENIVFDEAESFFMMMVVRVLKQVKKNFGYLHPSYIHINICILQEYLAKIQVSHVTFTQCRFKEVFRTH